LCGQAAALDITSYYSPRNRERPVRRRTDCIILHTTEGPKKGSLRKVRKNGETHYFVDTGGHVYRIIHRKRVSLHAGRSMWKGRRNLDNCSIGIEVVGYHNRDITPSQYEALKDLLAQLQKIYRMPDDRVLTHSMIAYGPPNRWHGRSHRGRKRCGMLFAKKSVRRKLGLDNEPAYDPDVRAGRLVAADPYLARFLYGSVGEQEKTVTRFTGDDANTISGGRTAWDIARDMYGSPETRYVFPDGRKLRGDEIRNWKKIPPGTRVILAGSQRDNKSERVKEVGVDGNTAKEIAGDEYNRKTTIYFLPDGRVMRGDELRDVDMHGLPSKTKILVGYIHGGSITQKRHAFEICGRHWNSPSTFYLFPDGSIRAGDNVDENSIPRNSMVFYRN